MEIQTQIRNFSRYPIDLVWENAQDLEHVGFLHSRTNKEFHLLYAGKDKGSKFEYDLMIYRSVRKLRFLRFHTFGFRKIISTNNIYQMEFIPMLGITTVLNSMLITNKDPNFPTMMVDEVVMKIPKMLFFLKNYFIKAMHRHATIQCGEDEPFRARRQQLEARGIHLPLSLFNKSQWQELTQKFSLNLNSFQEISSHGTIEQTLVASAD